MALQRKVNPFLFLYFFVTRKIKSISSPVFFVVRKTKKNGVKKLSEKPISVPPNYLLQTKAQFCSSFLFAHETEKKDAAAREKTMGKSLFLFIATNWQKNLLRTWQRFGPTVRPLLSLRLWSRRHSHRYPARQRAPEAWRRRLPTRRIVQCPAGSSF